MSNLEKFFWAAALLAVVLLAADAFADAEVVFTEDPWGQVINDNETEEMEIWNNFRGEPIVNEQLSGDGGTGGASAPGDAGSDSSSGESGGETGDGDGDPGGEGPGGGPPGGSPGGEN